MATVKTPNYTDEQTAMLKAAYLEKPSKETVEALAEKFGKTVRSIVAKLSKEGVYKAKEYTTKQGEKPIKKDEQADAIGKILRLSDGEADSLAKANKTALTKIVSALANSVPVEVTTAADKATKEVKASMIGMLLELQADDAQSLTRVNKAALDALFAHLGLTVPNAGEDDTQP